MFALSHNPGATRWKGIHVKLGQGNAFIYFSIITVTSQIGFLLQRAQELCGNGKFEPSTSGREGAVLGSTLSRLCVPLGRALLLSRAVSSLLLAGGQLGWEESRKSSASAHPTVNWSGVPRQHGLPARRSLSWAQRGVCTDSSLASFMDSLPFCLPNFALFTQVPRWGAQHSQGKAGAAPGPEADRREIMVEKSKQQQSFVSLGL